MLTTKEFESIARCIFKLAPFGIKALEATILFCHQSLAVSNCVLYLFSSCSQALTQMGYRFSPQFVDNLIAKYNPKGRRLTLDNFIVAFAQGLT